MSSHLLLLSEGQRHQPCDGSAQPLSLFKVMCKYQTDLGQGHIQEAGKRKVQPLIHSSR